jgi:hypothetical protein
MNVTGRRVAEVIRRQGFPIIRPPDEHALIDAHWETAVGRGVRLGQLLEVRWRGGMEVATAVNWRILIK